MKNATNRKGSNQFVTKPRHNSLAYVYWYIVIVAMTIGLFQAARLLPPIKTAHAQMLNPVVSLETDKPTASTSATVSPTPTETPMRSDQAYIMTKKHADILWRIYGLESSYGRNDGCKAHGGFNGFGFAQNTSTWNCFDSFTEVVDRVDTWLDRELATKTLAQSLCIYNQGIDESTCPYAQHFLGL